MCEFMLYTCSAVDTQSYYATLITNENASHSHHLINSFQHKCDGGEYLITPLHAARNFYVIVSHTDSRGNVKTLRRLIRG